MSHVYQFTYRVTECGIGATAIPQDTLIYSTDMHYVSKGTSSKYMIPVSCAAWQQAPRLTMPCFVNVASETGTTNQNGLPESPSSREASGGTWRPALGEDLACASLLSTVGVRRTQEYFFKTSSISS
ncbi:Placenta-Specific Protein 1 [Manis pentadactyla]|nr:Placenta-Specific Protein 1 [Manis pentadactyla]